MYIHVLLDRATLGVKGMSLFQMKLVYILL